MGGRSAGNMTGPVPDPRIQALWLHFARWHLTFLWPEFIDPSCALSSDSNTLFIFLHLRIPSIISQYQESLPLLELATL